MVASEELASNKDPVFYSHRHSNDLQQINDSYSARAIQAKKPKGSSVPAQRRFTATQPSKSPVKPKHRFEDKNSPSKSLKTNVNNHYERIYNKPTAEKTSPVGKETLFSPVLSNMQ